MGRLEEAEKELAEFDAKPFIEGINDLGETDMFSEIYHNRRVAELEGEIRGLKQAA